MTNKKISKLYSVDIPTVSPLTIRDEEPLYGSRKANKVKVRRVSSKNGSPNPYIYRVTGKKANVTAYLKANDLDEVE